MQVHNSTWPESFDQAPMINAPYDLSPTSNDCQAARKTSQENWDEIMNDVEAGRITSPIEHDFNMDNQQLPTAIEAHEVPRQSIEMSATLGAHPPLSQAGDYHSFYPHMHSEPVYGTWSATNTSMPPTYAPSIPEDEKWFAPLPQQQQQMMMTMPRTGLPAHIPSSYDSLVSYHQPAHHPMARPSPMLSAGSPPDSDYMEDSMSPYGGIPSPWLERVPSEEEDGIEPADPCYAQLLYQCLRTAPDNVMSLKELYDWVKEHSQKAKDPANRGWQNSVRHNLSMNAAFERVPPCESHGIKKGSLWRLTNAALRDGVISTTRYRKDPKHKPLKRSVPALKRQLSGAKGGQATRAAQRRQQQLREARSFPNMNSRLRHQQHFPSPTSSMRHQGPNIFNPNPLPMYNHGLPNVHSHYTSMLEAPTSPYFIGMDDPTMSPAPRSALLTPPQVQVLYDLHGHKLSSPAMTNFDFGHIDFTNGGMIGQEPLQDPYTPDTPSLGTEASFMSEEGMQAGIGGDDPTDYSAEIA
ncbi:hypothetical protein LTR62_005678 [Meristemomyces frigidus]|uniref:Fork-head domain-containing protein n=1 Tax=Meristemomyces frigidus TaxID=1508187 RepID=A0AAN7TDC0_9PEZI|nr:hypothetical protein LTR62_005678 [Meristemomyces frigidus]